jgi:hypothetical protein
MRVLDLRKITVDQMVKGMNDGQAWAWVLMRQLVGASAMISRYKDPGRFPTIEVEVPETLRSGGAGPRGEGA